MVDLAQVNSLIVSDPKTPKCRVIWNGSDIEFDGEPARNLIKAAKMNSLPLHKDIIGKEEEKREQRAKSQLRKEVGAVVFSVSRAIANTDGLLSAMDGESAEARTLQEAVKYLFDADKVLNRIQAVYCD